MFWISELRVGWHYGRSDSAQAPDDFSRLVEPPHVGVAGGKVAICRCEAWIVLDGEKKNWYCLAVTPADEMRLANDREGKADTRTRAETKRGLDMLDRKIRLPSHQPDAAALEPPAREARVKG
jgi:hypothetical protein